MLGEGNRQQRSKPIAEALATWAHATLRRPVGKSELAKAFRYMRSRWKALLRRFDYGRLALDNNPAERALRCVSLGGGRSYGLPLAACAGNGSGGIDDRNTGMGAQREEIGVTGDIRAARDATARVSTSSGSRLT